MGIMRTVLLGVALISTSVNGQDSLVVRQKVDPVRKTTIVASFAPGIGQIMNRQIWKTPLVWVGMGYAVWATQFNARELQASIDDLVAIGDDDPSTLPLLTDAQGNYYSAAQLEERAYFYRRNRDLSFLSVLLVHGLQILDANTGAMLRHLDTSDNLSAHLTQVGGLPGCQIVWNFQPRRHGR